MALATVKTVICTGQFDSVFRRPRKRFRTWLVAWLPSTGKKKKHSQAYTPNGIRHPHPHLSLLQDLLLFVVNATTCKWWASKASSKQLPSRHNRDFIINRNINKSNNHVSTVHKKDIIIQLPYLGLHSWHSSQISKRLKSCVYNFYSCVNLKIIFQNTGRIKSFFPYKDRLNRSQQSKVIYKAIDLGL